MSIKWMSLAMMAVCAGVVISGCSTSTGYVTLSYLPQGDAQRIHGAQDVEITVVVVDERAIKDRVSAKRNMRGEEIAPIVSLNEVKSALRDALTAEFKNRGFMVGSGGIQVEFTVDRFYNDFQPGFWARKANTHSDTKVRVLLSDGTEIFQKKFQDEWKRPVMLMSAKRAQTALNLALKEAVQNVFKDSGFLSALFKK